MSWNQLDPAIRDLAQRELTPRQLAVLQHRLNGHSWQTIADALRISRTTAREHHRAAIDKLRPHLRKDEAA